MVGAIHLYLAYFLGSVVIGKAKVRWQLHGLFFGVLYAPMQSLMFGFNFKQTVAWVVAGLPFDALHAGGNLLLCLIILPFTPLFKKAVQNFY